MAPTSSAESLRAALAPHAAVLHRIAGGSIRHGLDHGAPAPVRLGDYPAALGERLASFVTLRQGGALRGCVGSAEAELPLAEDVARSAFMAAFRDYRFRTLKAAELAVTAIEISVLTPFRPLAFADEDDLAARLGPGRDGLILEGNGGRGVFLPQVWETLSEPHAFLSHLKERAGLPPTPLDPAVRAHRFEAIKLAEGGAEANAVTSPPAR